MSPLSPPAEERDRAQPVRRTEDAIGPILFAISEAERGLGVRELARTLGVSKTIVGRVLSSLVTWNVVLFDEDRQEYRLGYGVVELASSYRRKNGLQSAAKRHLEPVRDLTGETVCINLLSGRLRVPIFQSESNLPVRYSVKVGEPASLTTGASGRVLLSQLDEESAKSLVGGELDAKRMARLLSGRRKALELGYAVSRGENTLGGTAVAVPLILEDPHAIGLYAPDFRIPDQRIGEVVETLRQAADSIHRELYGELRPPADEGGSA